MILFDTVVTDQTMEDHTQEEHHSAEDLLPSEATQIDVKEEQGYRNQRGTAAEPFTDNSKNKNSVATSRRQKVGAFDEDLEKIL